MNKQASLPDAFERALGEILARVSVSAARNASGEVLSIAVAYSGGLDSSVLLELAHAHAGKSGTRVFAFHVHHGLSPNADDWLTHCENECRRLNVHFDMRRISLKGQSSSGVEEAARLGRYAALGELCRLHGVDLLLTAHHLDDQAETVLLQLLRGSGVAGLAGMELANRAPILLGADDPVMARPLLGVTRSQLENYAQSRDIAFIEDESNADVRYARNALRHKVMPALAEFFPGATERIARAAQHAQSAQKLLNELAAQDLELCRLGTCLDLVSLQRLSDERIDNVLRYWFALRGVRMPATAWLTELRSQLFDAREDAQLCVTHPDCHIRRYRERMYLVARRDEATVPVPFHFRWHGERCVEVPAFGGALYFDEAEEGIDAEWLQQQDLVLQHRSGGERLKPASNRPTRSLKHHYQALDIPPWEREQSPLLLVGNDLLFAAGIGMDCRHFAPNAKRQIRCRWEADQE